VPSSDRQWVVLLYGWYGLDITMHVEFRYAVARGTIIAAGSYRWGVAVQPMSDDGISKVLIPLAQFMLRMVPSLRAYVGVQSVGFRHIEIE
jgi:hypothetical protein